MARRKRAYNKRLNPDPKYNSLLIAKLVNQIMLGGKKSVAERIIYDAFDIINKKTNTDPLEVFDKALKNVGPSLEIKGRRIGGANYQIPYEVKGDRKNTLAFRWIIDSARGKKGKPMSIKLADEIVEASKNQGVAVKKKEDTHRMAEANKAFAHFALR